MHDVERLVDELQQKIIKRYRAWLSENGLAIVFKESNMAMRGAGSRAIDDYYNGTKNAAPFEGSLAACWAAMLKEGELPD